MKIISRFTSVSALSAYFAVPAIAFAQGISTGYLEGYKNDILDIINGILVPVIIAIAFLVFLWGVYKYFIKGADSDTERTTGRTFVLYGIIGLVVIFSVWSIVQILMGTLGFGGESTPKPPTFNTDNSGAS